MTKHKVQLGQETLRLEEPYRLNEVEEWKGPKTI